MDVALGASRPMENVMAMLSLRNRRLVGKPSGRRRLGMKTPRHSRDSTELVDVWAPACEREPRGSAAGYCPVTLLGRYDTCSLARFGSVRSRCNGRLADGNR